MRKTTPLVFVSDRRRALVVVVTSMETIKRMRLIYLPKATRPMATMHFTLCFSGISQIFLPLLK